MPLEQVDGSRGPRCSRCDFVWYRDPKLVAGVIVSRHGRLLMVRRNGEPGRGRWAIPAGFVDAGEIVEEGAAREVWEETAIRVEPTGLVGVYSEAGAPIVFVVYAGSNTVDEAVAGPEASAVDWFSPDQLPELAFPRDRRIIAHWQERFTDSG